MFDQKPTVNFVDVCRPRAWAQVPALFIFQGSPASVQASSFDVEILRVRTTRLDNQVGMTRDEYRSRALKIDATRHRCPI